jgi:hypothetical protein
MAILQHETRNDNVLRDAAMRSRDGVILTAGPIAGIPQLRDAALIGGGRAARGRGRGAAGPARGERVAVDPVRGLIGLKANIHGRSRPIARRRNTPSGAAIAWCDAARCHFGGHPPIGC